MVSCKHECDFFTSWKTKSISLSIIEKKRKEELKCSQTIDDTNVN